MYFGLIFSFLSDTGEVFPPFATFVESMMSLVERWGVRHPYVYAHSPITFVIMLILFPSQHVLLRQP